VAGRDAGSRLTEQQACRARFRTRWSAEQPGCPAAPFHGHRVVNGGPSSSPAYSGVHRVRAEPTSGPQWALPNSRRAARAGPGYEGARGGRGQADGMRMWGWGAHQGPRACSDGRGVGYGYFPAVKARATTPGHPGDERERGERM